MNGIIKKIKNLFPVTTTKAVYLDGTNKTLQEAIDDGEIGSNTTTTTSGRGYCQVKLRGAKVFIHEVAESLSAHTRISYVFPNGDSDRLRRMYVWLPNGSRKSIDIPNGELALNEGLVYNFDTNLLEIRSGTWGNINVANNEILLLYNDYPNCVGGAFKEYIVVDEQIGIPIRELEFSVCATAGNNLSQGIFIIDDYMYCWGHSSDDKTTALGQFRKYSMDNLNTVIHTGTHNLGHMNAPSYCSVRDIMCVANGSKIYDQTALPMEGWLFPNFKSILEANPTNLVFDELEKIILDFSQFVGEYKAQICWGDVSTDFIYLMTCDNRIVRKLKLGKGTNNLGNGTFINGKLESEYNGTYSIEGIWRSIKSDIMGGLKYYNGYLFTGVKGDEYCIRKMSLCTNGQIKNEYILVNNKYGAMQGIDVKDNIFYAYTDGRGYKINADKI